MAPGSILFLVDTVEGKDWDMDLYLMLQKGKIASWVFLVYC